MLNKEYGYKILRYISKVGRQSFVAHSIYILECQEIYSSRRNMVSS